MTCSAIRRTERRPPGRVAWLLGAALVLPASVVPSGARADDPADASLARGLFFDARKLMADGNWQAACPKLAESERLHPAKGTEFNLADCYEHVGRLASAWTLFMRVVGEAHDANQSEHEELARKRAESIAPRIPTLVLEVDDAGRAPGLEVTRDGEVVPASGWSLPARMDPGPHSVVARAPGRVPFQTTIHLPEGKAQTLHVPALALVASSEPAPPAPAVPPPARDASVASAPSGAEGEKREDNQWRTTALALGGVGVAGLVAGGLFVTLSLTSRAAADNVCDRATNVCTTQDGVDDRARARTFGDAATVAFLGAGVLLAAGAAVWLLSPPGRSRSPLLTSSGRGSVGWAF
jgi:hypothetical protein